MAYKLNNCTDNQITIILDADSDLEQDDHNTVQRPQTKTSTKIKNAKKVNLDTSSDAENIFQANKYALPKRNLQTGRISLKVKLKKSAELSLYSIDTDSDYEKPIRKRHNRLERQRKKSHSEVESEGSYTDSKDNSVNIESINKKDEINENVDEKSIKNDLPRNSRNRRPPSKLSYYQCETLPPNSPTLRTRSSVNYNEDRLLAKAIITNIKYEQTKKKENKVLIGNKQNLESAQSTVKKNTNIASKNDKETYDKTNSKIRNAKSLKKTDKVDVIRNDKLDLMKKVEEITNKDSLPPMSTVASINITTKKVQEVTKEDSVISTPAVTPVKSIRQKRIISESTQKDVQQPDNNDNNTEEESSADVNKRIKISSAVNSSTPVKRSARKNSEHRRMIDNKNNSDEEKESSVNTCQDIKISSTPGRSSSRRKVKTEYRQIIDDTNNSDDERESLADMCRNIKISSPKKRILTPKKGSDSQKAIELHLEEIHLSTPKSRTVKCSQLTPSLGKRKSTLLKPATPLQEARSRLHVSAVPKSLPCREEEFNNIFTFLRGKLEDKSGGCMYISGVPGTGKTATVNEAVRCLQKLIMKGELADFDYVAINGMKLTEPRQAYVQILKQLDGRVTTWEQAYRILDKRFHTANSKMTLLLVDELDFVCTKRQDVVYNLLDWPTKSTAQLVVITIANTMDLPERVLMGRVTSRLGLTRLTFQPYNYKQLQEIVMSRLKDFRGFRAEAVQLAARKVSAVSGDARRALDICRRAMEIAESQNAEMISLQNVTQAVSEMIASAKVQAIKHCSKMEQIFLQAMSAEVTRTSIEEAYFIDVFRQLESICSFDGIEIPSVTEVLAVCGRLGANRLLICEHSRNDIYQKILLNVSPDDIHYAIQELDFTS
ncbi:origin recognition complex subunit 1 [Ceratina calcarata]|uniref:Origin recognition complex subunit 1 n=1 Tax=Ceratina calcarata TaxID=156304 RepID=A0AAJ7J7P1_9HYME|nr:origin recognition complex subunit 1 [Ceratina calcarata]